MKSVQFQDNDYDDLQVSTKDNVTPLKFTKDQKLIFSYAWDWHIHGHDLVHFALSSTSKTIRNDPSLTYERRMLYRKALSRIPRTTSGNHKGHDSSPERASQYGFVDLEGSPGDRWLETVSAMARPINAILDMGERIAHCKVRFIRRSQMRGEFHHNMSKITRATSKLGFDLFNRFGRLRLEYRFHPFLRGSGMWGEEVDDGDMLVIEDIFIADFATKHHLGRVMVDGIAKLLQSKTRTFYTFVSPLLLNQVEEADIIMDARRIPLIDRSVRFFRNMGFRRVASTNWFAKCSSHMHLSAKIPSNEDYDFPLRPLTKPHPLLTFFQQCYDDRQPIIHPAVYLRTLENYLRLHFGPYDERWGWGDENGNTILHLSVVRLDHLCIEWILSQRFGPWLTYSRNYDGLTPLDLLLLNCEKFRTRKTVNLLIASASDQFKGFNANTVFSLALLTGLGGPKTFLENHGNQEFHRLMRGCTCGSCLEGFLSPRMCYALLFQATLGYDQLGFDIDGSLGTNWLYAKEPLFRYLSPGMLSNFERSCSLRAGFRNLWAYVGLCLEKSKVPNRRNVLANGRNVDIQVFIEGGGTVESVFLAVYDAAMSQDKWAGNGDHQRFSAEINDGLPACRNDHEFRYVSGLCRFTHPPPP